MSILFKIGGFQGLYSKENTIISLSVDNLVVEIKKGNQDPYNLLNSYAAYLKNS